MVQAVAPDWGGCILRCALNVSGEMTSMVDIHIEDSSPVLRFRMLSGVLEQMDSLSGALEWMDS